MRSGVWIVVLVAVAAGGCGDEPTLSASAAEDLRARVAEVREAAGNGDRAAALEALEGLRREVRSLQDAGSLADADATALRRGIGRTRARVEEEVAEPTPEPTPVATATAEPTAEPDPPAGKPGKGKGRFKGGDEGGGEEGDD